jgi:hypothetical protein
MINEGAKILDERIAQRASDIDVVWTAGYGWPTYLGGPMFWAAHFLFGMISIQIGAILREGLSSKEGSDAAHRHTEGVDNTQKSVDNTSL